jgi:ribosome-binding factor A
MIFILFGSLAMSPRIARKDLQLCAQVRDILWYILGSTVGDDSLADLQVMSVEPLPDATRLLVTVIAPKEMDLTDATGRLQRATKAIRAEVAAAINRRKTPDLTFRVVHA